MTIEFLAPIDPAWPMQFQRTRLPFTIYQTSLPYGGVAVVTVLFETTDLAEFIAACKHAANIWSLTVRLTS